MALGSPRSPEVRPPACAASADPHQDDRTGAARCPNLAGREGVVIGTGRYRSTVRVMFDGFRSATSLHSTYIEPVAGEGPSGRDRR